jgi:hypothetical protein
MSCLSPPLIVKVLNKFGKLVVFLLVDLESVDIVFKDFFGINVPL